MVLRGGPNPLEEEAAVKSLREDHLHHQYIVRGSSDIERPGQSVHSLKERGRNLLVPTPEQAMNAGQAVGERPFRKVP